MVSVHERRPSPKLIDIHAHQLAERIPATVIVIVLCLCCVVVERAMYRFAVVRRRFFNQQAWTDHLTNRRPASRRPAVINCVVKIGEALFDDRRLFGLPVAASKDEALGIVRVVMAAIDPVVRQATLPQRPPLGASELPVAG